jgi:hypothetical protein
LLFARICSVIPAVPAEPEQPGSGPILTLVVAFVLSLTFVPAVIAILLNNSVQEHENLITR